MRARTLILTILTLLLAASVAAREEKKFSTRSLAETLTLDAGAPCRLIVDNVWGDVRVVAHDRPSVRPPLSALAA